MPPAGVKIRGEQAHDAPEGKRRRRAQQAGHTALRRLRRGAEYIGKLPAQQNNGSAQCGAGGQHQRKALFQKLFARRAVVRAAAVAYQRLHALADAAQKGLHAAQHIAENGIGGHGAGAAVADALPVVQHNEEIQRHRQPKGRKPHLQKLFDSGRVE